MNLTYVSFLAALPILGFIYFLKNKKINFGLRVLTAMILGIIFGAIFKKNVVFVEPIGKMFINLIKMLVIPLVVTSLISSITSFNNPEQFKKIGFKTIGLLILTTAIATVIGIFTGTAMDLGSGVNFTKDAAFKAREIPNFINVLLDMVPSNPIKEMADEKIIPIIIFSIFIAIAIVIEGSKKPEVVKPVKDLIDSFAQIMFRITNMVLQLTPYGVFGLMVSVSAKNGLSTLIPLAKVIIAMYIACVIHLIFVHGSLIAFVAKVNPITFFKKLSPALVVAFTTRSSYGTLPVTMKTLTERVKISDKIASFAAPLGASIGMNGGGGIYPALISIFVARIFNIHLSVNDYLLLVATTSFASIGIAGVPGAATIAATVVLSTLGLPIEGLAMVLGIDVIIDMIRTMTNTLRFEFAYFHSYLLYSLSICIKHIDFFTLIFGKPYEFMNLAPLPFYLDIMKVLLLNIRQGD